MLRPTVTQMSGASPEQSTKRAIRQRVLAARRRRGLLESERVAELLRDRVLTLPEMAAAETVAAYRSLPGEPGTGPLIEELTRRGVTVLLPLLNPDLSLGWAVHEPGGGERLNWLGVSEPASEPLRPQSLATASVVVCPGVAGDLDGHRLGRGGGSYDRALATLDHRELRCLLLYDDEVLDAVPAQPHDQPIDVLVTPTRTLWVGDPG